MKRVKRLLPGKVELSILLVLSLVCTLIVSLAAKADVALMFASMPLFFTACVMGMRRNGQLSSRPKRAE